MKGAITTNVSILIVKNVKIMFFQNVKIMHPDCPKNAILRNVLNLYFFYLNYFVGLSYKIASGFTLNVSII